MGILKGYNIIVHKEARVKLMPIPSIQGLNTPLFPKWEPEMISCESITWFSLRSASSAAAAWHSSVPWNLGWTK